LGEGMFTPPADIKEDADAYTVHLEVPGVSQDHLHLSLQDNVLTIKGSKEQKQESGEGRYRRIERSYGSFARSLSLPRNVDVTRVEANLEDGVLEVRLPKREESKPRQINVGVTQNAGAQTVVAQNGTSQDGEKKEAPPQGDTSTQNDTAPVDGNEQAAGGNSEDAPEGNPT